MLQEWCAFAFNILIPKCPSRHNGLHFLNSPAKVLLGLDIDKQLTEAPANISWSQHAPRATVACISHTARWLPTCRFSEPTFRPSGATKHWKHCFATFLPFRAPWSSFYWLFFSLTALTTVAASVHKSEAWLLNLLRWGSSWGCQSCKIYLGRTWMSIGIHPNQPMLKAASWACHANPSDAARWRPKDPCWACWQQAQNCDIKFSSQRICPWVKTASTHVNPPKSWDMLGLMDVHPIANAVE